MSFEPRIGFGLLALAAAASATAQTAQPQVVRPPVAQAWIDVATFAGMGTPGFGAGGANPMAALGSLLGGRGAQKVSFGMTQSGSSGRYLDVTVSTRRNPQLAEAQQQVPVGFMSPALQLVAPREAAQPAPVERDDEVVPERQERPQGRLLLYWGCGDAIRPGQPKVLDFASASAGDMAQFFQSRRATQRGAHPAAGRPSWPNDTDGRAVSEQASLVGQHAFSGQGLPESFRFAIGAAQDFMPPLAVQQQDQGGATALSWSALPNARGYFVAGMGARGQNEMVMWTSSELPETGSGLVDYQTNAAVDRWVREKVLLAPDTTRCTVPRGVFAAEGAMLRSIAYGPELNLAHPPRPTDPRAPWEPEWAVKVRVKSVHTTMLGMPAMGQPDKSEAPADRGQDAAAEKKADKKPGALDVLRGVLGR